MAIRDIYGFDFDPNDPGEAPYLSPEPDIDLSRYLENPRIFNNVSLPSVRPDGTNWNTEDIVVRQTPEQIPDYEPSLYTPEGAVNRAKYLSSQGINPIFTNTPIDFAGKSYADSGQIATDMRPPYGEPSNDQIKFVDELSKFIPYLENAAGKIYGYSYTKPEDVAKKDAFIKMGIDKFKADYVNRSNLSLQGLDPDTKEPVFLDPKIGLVKSDRTPYTTNKPLLPKTENTFNMNQPSEQEFQADKQMIMNGQLLISDVIRNGGRGGQGQAYARRLREAIHAENPNFNFQLADMVRKGDQTELNQTQGMRGKILSFEKTAIQNAKQVYNLIDQINPSQIPLINKALLAGKTQITGDPKASAFMTAWRTFVNEYARVSTTATGAGVTSDTARKEMEDVIKASSNAEQLKANVKQAVLEMSHRRYGFDAQLEEIYNRYGKRTDFKAELPTEEYVNNIFASPTPNVNRQVSRSEYFSAMKKANPKASDLEINTYLDKKGIK